MKTAIKVVVALCVIGWAVHNPGQVGADIGRLMAAGESFVSSVMDAGGSALSGVTGGVTGPPAPAPTPAPASPAPAPAPAPTAPAPAPTAGI